MYKNKHFYLIINNIKQNLYVVAISVFFNQLYNLPHWYVYPVLIQRYGIKTSFTAYNDCF